jgi:thiol:disulfide interchange protein DsbD
VHKKYLITYKEYSMFLESILAGAHSLPLVIFASFIAGILASFTPCIYPMLPITVGIITSQKTGSMLSNFFLSLSYGLGIATVYALLGYVSVTSNLMFGQWLANRWFIGAMIALFLYLAGSLFDFYEMYTPSFLTPRTTTTKTRGSFTYSFALGLLTGAAASPCLTPALALLLGFAAKQANPLAGIAVLFAFAMGLSTLLIILGTFSGSIALLPRAGSWMNDIKKIFGFLLLGVCVYYAQPLFSDLTIAILSVLLASAAGLYYTLQTSPNRYLQTTAAIIAWLLTGLSLINTYQIFKSI